MGSSGGRAVERLSGLVLSAPAPVPVLIGAGCSIPAGALGGDTLAQAVLEKLYPYDAPELPDAPTSAFERAFEEIAGGPSLAKAFLDAHVSGLQVTAAHEGLAQLVSDGVLSPWILTTNYDALVEQSLNAIAPGEWDIIVAPAVSDDELSERLQLSVGRPTVLKLHGDIADPASLCCTADSVQRFSVRLHSFLVELVRESGLIAIGHRLRDPDISQVLADAAPSRQFVASISLDELASDTRELLSAHKSTQNIFSATFEQAISALSERSSTIRLYATYQDDLQDAWENLDRWRDADSPEAQKHVDEAIERLPTDRLHEARGLEHFRDFAASQSADWWSLSLAVEALRASFRGRATVDDTSRVRITSRYVHELTRAVFASFDVLAPMGDERAQALAAAVDDARGELDRADRGSPLDSISLRVSIGEACKELFTLRSGEQNSGAGLDGLLVEASELLRSAIRIGQELPTREEALPWLAKAFRHLAVVHEFQASLTQGRIQARHYQKWLDHSAEAVELARQAGNLSVEGYALMNLAAAMESAGSGADALGPPAYRLEEAVSLLSAAGEHFTKLRDERGLAWTYVHKARLYGRLYLRFANGLRESEAANALLEMRQSSLVARTWSRRVGTDLTAIGYSEYFAAYALLTAHRETAPELQTDSRTGLMQALKFAASAQEWLSRTHRTTQAARCALLRAQATRLLADLQGEGDDRQNPKESSAEALALLAESIRLLSRSQLHSEDFLAKNFEYVHEAVSDLFPQTTL